MDGLPDELILAIAEDHLGDDQAALANLCRASHRTKRLLRTVLHRHIRIRKADFPLWLRTLNDSLSLGAFVQRAEFGWSDLEHFWELVEVGVPSMVNIRSLTLVSDTMEDQHPDDASAVATVPVPRLDRLTKLCVCLTRESTMYDAYLQRLLASTPHLESFSLHVWHLEAHSIVGRANGTTRAPLDAYLQPVKATLRELEVIYVTFHHRQSVAPLDLSGFTSLRYVHMPFFALVCGPRPFQTPVGMKDLLPRSIEDLFLSSGIMESFTTDEEDHVGPGYSPLRNRTFAKDDWSWFNEIVSCKAGAHQALKRLRLSDRNTARERDHLKKAMPDAVVRALDDAGIEFLTADVIPVSSKNCGRCYTW